MRFIRFARRQLGRLMLLAGMILSLGVLGIGLLRYYSFDLHMWRGDYVNALKCAAIQEAPEDMEAALPPDLFAPPDDMDAMVKWYWRVTDFFVGDRTDAAFDHAKRLYDRAEKEGDGWEESIKALQLAYSTCCGRNGKVKPEYRSLASAIKTMAGNAAFNSHPDPDEKKQKKKLDEAVANYEEAIRLDPSNAEARHENERRKQNSGGGGGSGDNKDPKPQNGSPAARTKI